jgi:hypothetical protein
MQENPMPATGNMQAPPGLAKITSKYNGKGHAACHQIGEKPLTGDVTSARGQTTFGCALPKGTIVVTTWLGPHFQQGTPQTVVFLLYSMHSIDSSVYSWAMRNWSVTKIWVPRQQQDDLPQRSVFMGLPGSGLQ